MTAPSNPIRTYAFVCAGLIGLTLLTLGLSFVPMAGIWHLVCGLGISVCCGASVLFFMRIVKSSVTWIVISVVCFWIGILAVLTLGDYITRGMVPFMPGH